MRINVGRKERGLIHARRAEPARPAGTKKGASFCAFHHHLILFDADRASGADRFHPC
mgnify:CR=1 FL=1